MTGIRKGALVLVIVAVIAAGAGLAFVILSGGGNHQAATWSPPTNLPAGCSKPEGGYLIIADESGFNGSKALGAPSPGFNWPVISVTQGSNLTIVVCNVDPTFAHGFQITHYFDSNIESVGPGKVIMVSLVTKEAGTFTIYCSIFCPPHVSMQSGELKVTAA